MRRESFHYDLRLAFLRPENFKWAKRLQCRRSISSHEFIFFAAPYDRLCRILTMTRPLVLK
jgi:hypothetical protein